MGLKQGSLTSHKLLCILAHPDDESLGAGGSIAKYAAEGVDVQLICATRGERGRYRYRNEARDESTHGATDSRRFHRLGYLLGDYERPS